MTFGSYKEPWYNLADQFLSTPAILAPHDGARFLTSAQKINFAWFRFSLFLWIISVCLFLVRYKHASEDARYLGGAFSLRKDMNDKSLMLHLVLSQDNNLLLHTKNQMNKHSYNRNDDRYDCGLYEIPCKLSINKIIKHTNNQLKKNKA